jgi:hypothetical protein
VERTHRPPRLISVRDFPVVPPDRAVVDMVRRMNDRSDVRAVMAEAVQRGYATVHDLERELTEAQRRGTALAREVMDDVKAGIRAAPEGDLRHLVLQSGLPEPLWNPMIYALDGTFIASPDGYFEEVGLCIESDSRLFHATGDGWQRTLERHGTMTANGLIVLHYPPARVSREPELVLDEIRRTYAVCATRAAPRLIVRSRRAA